MPWHKKTWLLKRFGRHRPVANSDKTCMYKLLQHTKYIKSRGVMFKDKEENSLSGSNREKTKMTHHI